MVLVCTRFKIRGRVDAVASVGNGTWWTLAETRGRGCWLAPQFLPPLSDFVFNAEIYSP